jgi:hypothetical protein
MVREVTDRSTPAPPPTLDAPFPIQVSQVEQFTRNGFLKLTNVLDPETIERYGAAVTRGVVERNTMHLPLEQRSAYDKAFLQVENLWQHSAEVREFVFGRRLAQIAADLLGVDGVRLYHDQALYKEPGGGLTPWHADQFYWPLSSDRACTVWIPLQKTPWTLGPLQFAAGSHRFEIGRDLPISELPGRGRAIRSRRRQLPPRLDISSRTAEHVDRAARCDDHHLHGRRHHDRASLQPIAEG